MTGNWRKEISQFNLRREYFIQVFFHGHSYFPFASSFCEILPLTEFSMVISFSTKWYWWKYCSKKKLCSLYSKVSMPQNMFHTVVFEFIYMWYIQYIFINYYYKFKYFLKNLFFSLKVFNTKIKTNSSACQKNTLMLHVGIFLIWYIYIYT